MSKKKILLIGATGWLGGKIAKAVCDHQNEIEAKAFVRETSNSKKLEELGIGIIKGNLFDKTSVVAAFAPTNFDGKAIDAMIYSATSHTMRQRGDSQTKDLEIFKNVLEAFVKSGAKRFVLVSAVACDKAKNVPHLNDKFLFEEELKKAKISFVSVRAPFFLDQDPNFDFNISSLPKGIFAALQDPKVKMAYVMTSDYAEALVNAAIFIPERELPLILNYAIDGPISANDIADVMSKTLKREIVAKSPFPFALTILGVVGLFHPLMRDLVIMYQFINTGKFKISNEEFELAKKYFSPLRSIDSAAELYVMQLQDGGANLSPKGGGFLPPVVVAVLVIAAAFVAYLYLYSA
jgi:uncharacterized protein YbjT (DUF2867 family)